MRLNALVVTLGGLNLVSASAWATGTITGVSVSKPIIFLSSKGATVDVTISGTGVCQQVRLRCDVNALNEVPPVIPPNTPFDRAGEIHSSCTYMEPGTYTLRAIGQPPANCPGTPTTTVEVRHRIKLSFPDIVSPRGIAIARHGTFATFTISTTKPAAFEVQVSTDPTMSGGVLANVESAGFTLSHTTKSTPIFLPNLKPNTLYNYLLKVKPKDGFPYKKKGTFTTLSRRVDVTFEKIHMTDDSDDLSDCDCGFGFTVSGASMVTFTGDVSSGTDVHPNRTVVVTNAPASLKVGVLGWDDDEDELIPFGPFLIAVLNTCGALPSAGSSGDCDGDAARDSTMIDTDLVTGPGENTGTGKFTLNANGPALKYTVTGSYKTTYQ